MNDEDYKTLEAMDKYGGSFVQSLASLARQADPINLQKIKATWPDYWVQYHQMAKEDEKIKEQT